MASSGSVHLRNIDEQFCQCPICLQQYREPKLLPCLHRYCSDCLKQLVHENQRNTTAHCPQCRSEFTIPPAGVDGLKTDFHMENIVEYIKIQNCLENEQQLECYGCSDTLKITSYCFKCNGFLCTACHEFHMSKKVLKDHKEHVLSLEDLKSKDMTLEKLSDLKGAPRCESHPEDLCRLCCRTCDNLPICVTCTYGSHKNHDINEGTTISAENREKLKQDLKHLSQYRRRMLKLPETVGRVEGDLTSKIREKTKNLMVGYEIDMQTVKKETTEFEDNVSLCHNDEENEENAKLTDLRKQMYEEMNQLEMAFDNICEKIKEDRRMKLANLRQKQEEEIQKSKEKLTIMEKDFQTFVKTLETRQRHGTKELQEISQQISNIMDRYGFFTATANSALQSRNDWTAVQCIPDTCLAAQPLVTDMKSKFTASVKLPSTEVSSTMTEDKESPVEVEDFQTNDRRITGITDCSDGNNIVLTGRTSATYQSHITVINMKGKVLQSKEFKSTLLWCLRYCTTLSEFKVATTCSPHEIGIFDLRDYSYIKKTINSWPSRQNIMCVATDPVNNHILVGGHNSTVVYVYDDQLNFHHMLTLPEIIKYPFDMTVNGCYLLICDREGKGAYIVREQGLGGKLIHKFAKPELNGDDWNPINVCKDSNERIYILWMMGSDFSSGRRVVTQYTQDGRWLLTTKQIEAVDARCIAVVMTGITEKLLVATWRTGKIYVYNLT